MMVRLTELEHMKSFLLNNEIYREVYESQTGGSGDFDEKGGDQ